MWHNRFYQKLEVCRGGARPHRPTLAGRQAPSPAEPSPQLPLNPMVQNPPPGTQRIVPYVLYADAAAAIDFLKKVCGFEEYLRFPAPNDTIGHAEISYQENRIMVATAPSREDTGRAAGNPAHYGIVSCYVDDVDAHYAQAKAAGAEIHAEIEDKPYGDRSYSLKDPEGHVWYFTQHVRDVDFSAS
ncbi:MAG: putative glyoxalase superfamily protein PhnB [Planctomycetota bacterium]|jgi:uncharacterized glyoxalase superfamily protein PhnB